MNLIEDGKRQALVLSYREIEALISFSSPDEKVPTLNGASILLEDRELIAYASDGRKSVRGSTVLKDKHERATWLIPRSELLFADRALLPGQDGRFVLHPKTSALTTFEIWEVEVDGTNKKMRTVDLEQPIPCNTQMGLPLEAIDNDLGDLALAEGSFPVTLPASAFNALKRLSLAGSTPNLTLEVSRSGFLHARAEGGMIWHAIVRPSVPADALEEDEDDSLDEEGKLELQPSEKRKRGRPKGRRNKRNGKQRLELV